MTGRDKNKSTTFQIKKATQFPEVEQLDCDHVIRKRAHTAWFNEIAYGPRRWIELNSAGALTRDNKMALTPKSSTKRFNNKSYNLISLKLLFFLRSVIVSVIYFLSSGFEYRINHIIPYKTCALAQEGWRHLTTELTFSAYWSFQVYTSLPCCIGCYSPKS